MTALVINISGCGGGDKGPQGIYPIIKKLFSHQAVSVINIDTTPDELYPNIQKVAKLAFESSKDYKKIILVGYSMGGAVAALTANQLNQDGKETINGIALLSTQTDGLQHLGDLNIPILFYHGSKDPYFSSQEIESIFSRYQGPKKLVQVENLGHNLAHEKSTYVSSKYVHELAKDIHKEINSFFLNSEKDLWKPEEATTKTLPLRLLDQLINRIFSIRF